MNDTRLSAAQIIARSIAIALSVLFVLTALASLILFNIERNAFNAATYKRALIEENFYRKFPLLLGDLLAKNLDPSAPAFAQQMTADNWKALIETLLPPQQVQAMTEDAINQFFAYLNGETTSPRASLVPLKQSLTSPAGLDAALKIIQAQPVCTLKQIARILTTFGQEICNPPPEILQLLHPLIKIQLEAAAAAIPDEVPLLAERDPAAAQSRLRGLMNLRLIMRLSPLIPIAILFGITLLAVRSFKGWLAWWGWPLLFTGLFGTMIGFGGAPLVRRLFENMLAKRAATSMPLEIADAIRSIVDAAFRQMLKPAGWEGLFLFIAGLSMILISFYAARREKKARLAASEAETQVF